MDYWKAQEIMSAHYENVRKGKGVIASKKPFMKKVANNTWLERVVGPNDGVADVFKLRYHKVEILKFYTQTFEINPSGWFSATTHQRLNEYMPPGFRVSGCTYPELNLKRPLGFVHTPTGTYPYRMPMKFDYDGHPADPPSCDDAANAVAQLSAYVERHLDLLLSNKGERCTYEAREDIDWLEEPTGQSSGDLSRQVGVTILTNTTYRYLISVLEPAESAAATIGWLSVRYAGKILGDCGAVVFKKPRTAKDKARRLEHVLFYGHAIPDVPLPTLRKQLRRLIIGNFIDALGFDIVEWNRRAR